MEMFKYKVIEHWHISDLSMSFESPILEEHWVSYESDLTLSHWLIYCSEIEWNKMWEQCVVCSNVMEANVTWLLPLLHLVPRSKHHDGFSCVNIRISHNLCDRDFKRALSCAFYHLGSPVWLMCMVVCLLSFVICKTSHLGMSLSTSWQPSLFTRSNYILVKALCE